MVVVQPKSVLPVLTGKIATQLLRRKSSIDGLRTGHERSVNDYPNSKETRDNTNVILLR